MVGDYYREKWIPGSPGMNPLPDYSKFLKKQESASKEDLEALKKEVLEMKELLKRAVKYDEKNGEPHCEMDDKVELLKKVAELVGVDLKDVFPTLSSPT